MLTLDQVEAAEFSAATGIIFNPLMLQRAWCLRTIW